MPPQLTPREHEILIATISEMGDLPKIDFGKVAEKLGVAYAKNARSSFLKVWKKLGNADGSSLGDGEENDGDASSAAVTPVKTPKKGIARKTPVKKGVGPAGPKKASTPARGKAAAKAEETDYGVKNGSEEVDLAAIQAYSGGAKGEGEMDTKPDYGSGGNGMFDSFDIYGMDDGNVDYARRAPTPGA